MKIIVNYLIILLLMPTLATAGIPKGKYIKERKISKSYTVNNNAGLQVGNKYGNIVITPWDEDRTEIEVVITVSGNNEDNVLKRFNSLDVEFEATRELVKAFTKIGNFRGMNINMEINYTIKIPRNGTLGVGNQYGGIKLGRINGGMNIDCQYGSLTIDEANAENNTINLQYCDASRIGYIKAAKIKMQYSGIYIVKLGMLTASADYSEVTIDNAGDVNMGLDYSELTIGNADKVNVRADYTALKVGHVDDLLNIKTEYGDVTVKEIAASARSVVVNSTYGTTKLAFADAARFTFEFELDYGSLSGQENLKFSEKSDKDSSAHYKGSSNTGSGACKVYVKSEYGDIKINRNHP
ncbi:DUF4097 family beta strand repeat-containing protein [Flavobacterium sp. RHBU_24]|uniref:DUF4097 family beta strand repeat-containing protein n=1 Tax=Flavobacterium sp. RHBU_24 TaxID=3391185 RepID=UPI003984FE7C